MSSGNVLSSEVCACDIKCGVLVYVFSVSPGETSIVVSSGDEGVSPSSSQEGRTAGRMKRRRIVTPHTLFRGAK